jgi:hypothetical protein
MNMQLYTRYFRWLIRHFVATYVLMVCLFVVFGILSLDLVKYVSANANLLLMYGRQALLDGGLMQLAELWFKSFAAILAYLGFKLCEHALIERAAFRHEGS